MIEYKKLNKWIYIFVIFCLYITVGLRYQVGGDWGTYLQNYKNLSLVEFSYDIFFVREPGWIFFSYLSKIISSNEIYPLNLLSAGIFFLGINAICKNSNRKFLALAISYPILIILVGMGYTRQSVAIGFCFMSLEFLNKDNERWKFFLYSFLAFTFHNTSIFFSSLVFLLNREIKYSLNIIALLILLLFIFLEYYWEYFYKMSYEYFIHASYKASGAIPRGIPIFLSSFGLLYLSGYINKNFPLKKNIFIIPILIFILMVIVAPFTALDRLILFFSFIYIYFLSNVNVNTLNYSNLIYEITVLALFCIYLIIWFTYGNNFSFWIPYNNYLIFNFL